MSIRIKEYEDFSLRLHAKGAHKPISGQFELTHRCNLRCQHCCIVNDTKKRELTHKELCRIFDEVYREGCLWLCFTGGEPLLREDFLDIYSYAFKKGFVISIFTSATLFSEGLAKYLKRFPPFYIDVTLNGATKKTYELVTQVEGSFEKAMQGIELIRKYNLPLKIKSNLMTLNIDELPLINKFCKRIKVEFICSVEIDPRIDGSREPCFLRLPMEKRLELRRDEGTTADMVQALYSCDDIFRCPAGTWTFHVNPFGELFLCNAVRKPSCDLCRNSFKEGFYGLFSQIRSRKFKSDSKCRTCELWQFCSRCPGMAEREYGDAEIPIPYYCELAKITLEK